MYNGILARRKIAAFKRTGKEKIVVLPYGEYGRWFETRMKCYGMEPIYCIDNQLADNIHVFKMDDCRFDDVCVTYLIATEKAEVYSQLKENLLRNGVEEKQIESAQDEFDEVHQIMTSPDKLKLDFLCVGQGRCGTGALNVALKRNPNIFLPPIKEKCLFQYLSDERHKFYKQDYVMAHERKYTSIGGVEPTYIEDPDLVYHYYGSALKILICVRHPITRLLSLIRLFSGMPYRDAPTLFYYKKYGQFSPELIDAWARDIAQFQTYYEPIKYFLRYYPIKQIKFVVYEELYANPSKVMDEIQDFLGLTEQEKIQYDSWPKLNLLSDKVSIDYQCACINRLLLHAWESESDMHTREKMAQLFDKVKEYTTCDGDVPMPDSTRQYLTELFREDIRKTEELIGRPLPYFKD